MRYLSVCSGIEAATVAWHSLGWTPVAFSEIEPFPCSLLAHHYPNVPNWGDMTKFKEWPDACVCDSGINAEQDGNCGTERVGMVARNNVHAEHQRQAFNSSNKGQFCEQCGGTIVDVLVGGTPCQSFSVAGLRKGLADPRGNLALTFLAIADKYRPRWLVWENVPGVLSSHGGRDFGAFLSGLADLGYGWAYRVLDAQFFGLAQRRKRVFVVGCLGNWAAAAAVLFERESLQGHPAPSRETGEGIAAGPSHSLRASGFDASEDGTGRGVPLTVGTMKACKDSGGWSNSADHAAAGYMIPAIVGTLSDGAHNGGGLNGQDAYTGRIIAVHQRGRNGSAGLVNADAGDP